MKIPSCFHSANNADVFKQILTFFCPPPKKILDVCCGYRRMWQELVVNQPTLYGKGYEVKFMDIRPEVKPDVVGNYFFAHEKFGTDIFNVIVYDPPYAPKLTNPHHKAKEYTQHYALSEEGIKPHEFKTLNHVFPQLLKYHGYLIVKLGDYKGHFPAIDAVNNFTNFELQDFLIQTWSCFMPYESRKQSTKNHCYWLIFRKL